MLLVADVRADRAGCRCRPRPQALWGIEKLNVPRSTIPAVTHVDYSARIQTVRRETNPLYYDIIDAFYRRTGCPVIVNTSFNVRGEPIVCTPEDAYRCFMRTDMDVARARELHPREDRAGADRRRRILAAGVRARLSRRTLTAALLLAVATLALYAWRIGEAPIYPSPDEMLIAVDAHTLSTTGRDGDGTLLPLYFRVHVEGEKREGWFMPVAFYLIALSLRILPLSVAAIRMPSVCLGVLDVVLMFLVAERLFGRRWLALFAASALALTPAHMMLSRYALDYLYPLPFLLGWLLCLSHYMERDDPRLLLAATLCLGVGFYSYIAAIVMMPVYLLLTALVLWQRKSGLSRYGVAAAGFGLPLVGVAVWLAGHPGALGGTADRYDLGLRSFLSFLHIDEMATLYWSFFNPSFLFITGDRTMMFSTRLAGVFLVSIAFLLALGIRRALAGRTIPLAPILLLGFATAPLAAVLVPEAGAINRAVEIMPFAILLATVGLESLWSGEARCPIRLVAVGLVALMPIQFALFAHDYFGDYRLRSAPWLGGNLRGALDSLSARAEQEHAPAVYFATLRATSGLLDIRNRWMDSYWKFCLLEHGRQDLLQRTVRWDGQSIAGMPSGALVLANVGDVPTGALVRAGALKSVQLIPEVKGDPFFVVLER